jgi:hypothetical protein
MLLRRLLCLVALVALGALTVVTLAVPAHAKLLNGCALLAQEELETIFEQPFAKGTVLQGDYCEFHKPSGADIPNIVVQVLVNRSKTPEKAKQVYQRAVNTSTELAGGATEVRGVGDDAFSAYFLGVDEVTVLEGRVVGRFRVDEPDTDNTYAEQVVAVAQAAAPRLENYSKAG